MTRHPPRRISRRRFLCESAMMAGYAGLGGISVRAAPDAADRLLHVIPSSGERIPAIGLGTYITFNVGSDPELRAARTRVLERFFDHGGGMIDSSPMYGTSEEVIGHCLEQLGMPSSLFSATKIWTRWDGEGREQHQRSLRLWNVNTLDLQQVHNLVNWEDHLKTIRAAREEGTVRYVGITTSHGRRHDDFERVMKQEPLDFVQLTYNILNRAVEDRLLPLAADRGMAVIANRPFGGGGLISRLQRYPLPDWASEIDAANWARFLLKFIVSHPSVTCAIPATSRVGHMEENMGALYGAQPDAAMRRRMIRYVESL